MKQDTLLGDRGALAWSRRPHGSAGRSEARREAQERRRSGCRMGAVTFAFESPGWARPRGARLAEARLNPHAPSARRSFRRVAPELTRRHRRRWSLSRTAVHETGVEPRRLLREACESEPEAEQDCRSSSKATVSSAWTEMPACPPERERRSRPGIVLLGRSGRNRWDTGASGALGRRSTEVRPFQPCAVSLGERVRPTRGCRDGRRNESTPTRRSDLGQAADRIPVPRSDHLHPLSRGRPKPRVGARHRP